MFFLTVLIAWFYSTLQHEVAHAVFAWKRGASVKIYPYWHWLHLKVVDKKRIVKVVYPPWKRPPQPRKFYFARNAWKGGGKQTALEHAAPIFHDTIVIVATVILWAVLDSYLPLIFAATSLIDTSVWMYGYFWGGPHTDGQKFRAAISSGTFP